MKQSSKKTSTVVENKESTVLSANHECDQLLLLIFETMHLVRARVEVFGFTLSGFIFTTTLSLATSFHQAQARSPQR